MSYRFTNTEKWGDAWFSELTQTQKLLFIYLCDNCDIAGFIELKPKIFAVEIGTDLRGFEGALKGLNCKLIYSTDQSCVYISNFLKHQKNLPLNENNKAHLGILKRFQLYAQKFEIQDINTFIEGACKGLLSPTGIGIGIGNGIGNGKEEGGVGKTKKQKVKKEFVPPTLDEVKQYFKENGFKESVAERAYRGYSENNWHDTKGNPVLNWKSKMNNVWFEDDNRIAPPQAPTYERKMQAL